VLRKVRRLEQRAPQEPDCPTARCNTRFKRHPDRVVKARHTYYRRDLAVAHRPHQHRAGRPARQNDCGSDGQGRQHANDKGVGVVQRQRQQRAVPWADDIQFLQRLDIGRDVAVGQNERLRRAGGTGGPGQQRRLVGGRGRQILRPLA
jgi:hypothetical protein